MARFLHTGDWQLGMTRHFLDEAAQSRFTDARFEAIRTLGRLADAQRCEFVVVCGDVFESNQVDRRTVARAAEALVAVPVPVYLLPGNHDPLDAGSVFRSRTWLERRPAHVHVLEDAAPRVVRPGLEVVGAPWTSKRPLRDLVAAACETLPPASGTVRVLAGHGCVDTLSPDPDDPAVVRLGDCERALEAGRVHYVALGDRHSLTDVGRTGRVRYAGAPEPTDYDEDRPGLALVVDAEPHRVDAVPHAVGTWRFLPRRFDLNGPADLDALAAWLGGQPAKERLIVRLSLVGSLTLLERARLDSLLEGERDLFAAIEVWDRRTELALRPDDGDFTDLGLEGFARTAVDRLRVLAAAPGAEGAQAQDALALLVRLAGRVA